MPVHYGERNRGFRNRQTEGLPHGLSIAASVAAPRYAQRQVRKPSRIPLYFFRDGSGTISVMCVPGGD